MLFLLAEIGDHAVWIILGLILLAVLAVLMLRSGTIADRELALEEVPTPVRHLILNMIPNWDITSILASYRAQDEPRHFRVRGEREGLPGEIEIRTRKKTVEIREVEVRYDLDPASRRWVHGGNLSEANLPDKVRQKLTARLEQFDTPVDSIDRIGQGQLGGQEGYLVEGSAGKWKFEVKTLGSGKIREIRLRAV